MKELISIIVPVYKVDSNYLKKCIDSILNQTYTNIEVLLINDGTEQINVEYMEKIISSDDRVKLYGDENHGVSYARNLGIQHAEGTYITFVDSDDFIDEYYCEKMLNKMIEADADCAICGYNRVYNKSREICNCDTKWNMIDGYEFLEKVLNVQEGVGFCHMKMIKTKILRENNVFFNPSLSHAEDAMFCIELAKHLKKVCKLNEPLYNYVFNNSSVVRKYDANYTKKYMASMLCGKECFLMNYSEDRNIQQLYYDYVVYHILLIIVNFCYHPLNGKNYIQKYNSIKEICAIPEFKEAIKNGDYYKLSISRRVTLFTIKYKLYVLTSIIAYVRQAQFRSKSNW